MTLDQCLKEAGKWAKKGKVDLMDIALAHAKENAGELDIASKVAEIQELGYASGVFESLKSARRHVKTALSAKPKSSLLPYAIGNLEYALDSAQKYAALVGLDVLVQINEIRQEIYPLLIRRQLAEVKEFVERGAAFMEYELEVVKKYASRVNMDIAVQVAEIEERGYHLELSSMLNFARKNAKKGEVRAMMSRLSDAVRFAGKLSEDISAQVSEIEHIGYDSGISIDLKRADGAARKREVGRMNFLLVRATGYAQITNRDISVQVGEIERKGYLAAVRANLREARKYARTGLIADMDWELKEAREYALKIQYDISSEEGKITMLIQK